MTTGPGTADAPTWAAIFERGAEFDADVPAVRSALADRRSGTRSDAGDDDATDG